MVKANHSNGNYNWIFFFDVDLFKIRQKKFFSSLEKLFLCPSKKKKILATQMVDRIFFCNSQFVTIKKTKLKKAAKLQKKATKKFKLNFHFFSSSSLAIILNTKDKKKSITVNHEIEKEMKRFVMTIFFPWKKKNYNWKNDDRCPFAHTHTHMLNKHFHLHNHPQLYISH